MFRNSQRKFGILPGTIAIFVLIAIGTFLTETWAPLEWRGRVYWISGALFAALCVADILVKRTEKNEAAMAQNISNIIQRDVHGLGAIAPGAHVHIEELSIQEGVPASIVEALVKEVQARREEADTLRVEKSEAVAQVERKLADLTSKHVQRLAQDADEYVKQERWADAVGIANELLEHLPDNAALYSNRGLAEAKRGNLERAIADFNKSILLDPAIAATFVRRGAAHGMQGNLNAAINDFSEAIRRDPELVDSYGALGALYFMQGNYDRALTFFDEAIRRNPKLAASYKGRAAARSHQDDLDGAIADFSEAIRLAPDDTIELGHSLALIYTKRGIEHLTQIHLDRAISDLNEAIRLDTAIAAAYMARGATHIQQGNVHQAIQDFAKGLLLDSSFASGLAASAVSLNESGFESEARQIWRELIAADPRYRDAYWVGQEFNWRPELVERARGLIASLGES